MAPFPCIATNTSPPLGGGARISRAPFLLWQQAGTKTEAAHYRRVLCRTWRPVTNRGCTRLMLDRRGLVHAPNTPPLDQSQHPRARHSYDDFIREQRL